MSVTVEIRFPLGRYHANPWDRNVNEGATEWPPSPWRLLRMLVSTWYTRWPELPAPVLDGLLDTLGLPSGYRTPEVTGGHTRHYLPGAGHTTGAPGGTELTLDPYLWVPRDEPLLVRWEAEPIGEQRETLDKLVELIPYLGRAESVCEARLLPAGEEPEPDGTWWRRGNRGDETARLLAPRTPIRRALLELATPTIRTQRRTVPPETRWASYARTRPDASPPLPASQPRSLIDTIRFEVVSRAPLTSANGVLLADEVHRIVAKVLDGGRAEVLGHAGAATDHRHAHWLPLADGPEIGARVRSIVIWVPATLAQDEVVAILGAQFRGISGWRAGGEDGYEVKGLPRLDLLLQAVGPVTAVAPELCRPARRWRSLTPYLPVRHHKPRRQTYEDFLRDDVRTELGYRGKPAAAVCREPDLSERWALRFRRYRMKETRAKARDGLGLRLEFDTDVEGPLLLGQLSHFGYGMFVPDDE